MLTLGLFVLVTLVAASWVMYDNNAVAAFEIFRRYHHRAARDMGMYWVWLLQCVLRATLLFSCVTVGALAAIWMLQQNPWDLSWFGGASLFAAMLACLITLLALPCLSAYVRLRWVLSFKAAELTGFVSILATSCVSRVAQQRRSRRTKGVSSSRVRTINQRCLANVAGIFRFD